MSYDGTLSFDTILDLNGLKKGMQKLESFIKQNKTFFTGMFKAADATELLEQKLTVLTGSSDSAQEALAHLEDSALSAQYGFGTVAAAVDKLVTHGMELSDAVQTVTAWGDAVTAYAGGSSTALTSVTGTLAELQTAGTVSMNHVNALMDAGIPVAEAYAAAMGTSLAEAQTALGNGTVSAASFLAAMNNAIENGAGNLPALAGAATQASTTWSGAFAHMQDSVGSGVAAILTSIDEANASVGRSTLKQDIENIGRVAQSVMEGVAGAITPVIKNLGYVVPSVMGVIGVFKSAKIIPIIVKDFRSELTLFRDAQDRANQSSQILTIATKKQTAAAREAVATKKVETAAKLAGVTLTKEEIAVQAASTAVTQEEIAAQLVSTHTVGAKTLVLGGLSTGMGVATVATTLLKGATEALSAAFKAMGGGFGVFLTLLPLIASGIFNVIQFVKRGSAAYQEETKALEAQAAAYEELASSIKDSQQSYEQEQRTLHAQHSDLKNQLDVLTQLSGKENKSVAEKQQLAQAVAILNSQMDGLNLAFDEESGLLSGNAEDIQAYVEAQMQQEEANAKLERRNELLHQQAELQQHLDELEAQRSSIDAKDASAHSLFDDYGAAREDLEKQQNDYLEQQRAITAELNGLNIDQAASDAATAQATIDALEAEAAAQEESAQRRADAISSFTASATDMFHSLKDQSSISVEEMIKNLNESAQAEEEYQANLDKLRNNFAEKGLDTAVLDYFTSMGTEGMAAIAQLANAQEGELENLVEAYARAGKEGAESGAAAAAENSVLYEEAARKTADVSTDTYTAEIDARAPLMKEETAAAVEQSWQGADGAEIAGKTAGEGTERYIAEVDARAPLMKEKTATAVEQSWEGANDAVNQVDFPGTGELMATKTKEGYEERAPELTDAAETAVDDTYDAALEAVEAQPFEGIGKAIVQEIIDGVNDMKGALAFAVQSAVSAALAAAVRMRQISSLFLPDSPPTGRSGASTQLQAEAGGAAPLRAEGPTMPGLPVSGRAPGIVARLQAVVTAQQSQYTMGGPRKYTPALAAQPATAEGPRQVNNYYNVSIDAKKVKEFNDVVKVAQRAVMSYRQGYVDH